LLNSFARFPNRPFRLGRRGCGRRGGVPDRLPNCLSRLGHTRVNAFVFHGHSPLNATQLPPGRVPLGAQSASGNYCCCGQRPIETGPHPIGYCSGSCANALSNSCSCCAPPDLSLQSTSMIAPHYWPPYTRLPLLRRRRRGGTPVLWRQQRERTDRDRGRAVAKSRFIILDLSWLITHAI
jgi:hypothetical protein